MKIKLLKPVTLKKIIILFVCFFVLLSAVCGQNQRTADFSWSNTHYFNLNAGEAILFNQTEVRLLQLDRHFNQLQIGRDTVWMKVSRRTLPVVVNGLRVFVADNKNVKALASDSAVHGLLTKDALIGVSSFLLPLLDPQRFIFPVSFSDGFVWRGEEAGYLFAWQEPDMENNQNQFRSHSGIDLDLHDAKGQDKHWLVAVENSAVAWVESFGPDNDCAAVLLQSELQPAFFYLYQGLNVKNIQVRKGSRLRRGEPIGTVAETHNGQLHFSVVLSDTIPEFKHRNHRVVNCFPQIFELYYNRTDNYPNRFSKGRILLGPRSGNGHAGNNDTAFEEYLGKGWVFGPWNIADKTESALAGGAGNVRLRKIMFKNSPAECKNPEDSFVYEINVPNGAYRIRAKIGDAALPAQQQIWFEDVDAGTYATQAAEFRWTPERVVSVNDGKLSISIRPKGPNNQPAGIGEIVFQRAK